MIGPKDLAPPQRVEAERRIAEAAESRPDHLSLSRLGLKALPILPENLSFLRGLDLSGNRLASLDIDPTSMQNLEHLDLGDNRFAAVPPEVLLLSRLQSLDLSQNRLVALPASLGDLSHLSGLRLYNNRIAEIPAKLLASVSLKRLDLSKNLLSSLPKLAGPSSPLEVLDLSGNDFSNIPCGLAGLRSLDLAGNRIESSDGIERLQSLEYLDLSMNRLAVPPLAALDLKHLRALAIYGNPFGPTPEELYHLTGEDLRKHAADAVAASISGGMEEGKRYFEPVSFVIGCVVALGGFTGLSKAVERFYKQFDDVATVVLEFPSGSKVSLANVTYKRAIEIAREHENELGAGGARLHFADTKDARQVDRSKAYAVDVLTRIAGTSLILEGSGAAARQFIIVDKPVFNIGENVMGDKIEISNVNNSILNVKAKLDHVSQSILTAPVDPANKEELRALVEQLNGLLQKVPAEKHEDAGAVADSVKETMDKVNQGNPNKKSLANSLNGLLSVAKNVAEALPVATKIATVVAGMFGIPL